MGETTKSAKWSVEERSDTQAHETWMIWRRPTPWVNVTCDIVKHTCKYEKMWRMRCTVYTYRRKQQIVISCKRSCCNKWKNMSSISVHSTVIMGEWKKKMTNITFGIDKKVLVQIALLQIHGGDGAYLSVLLGSLIGVSSMHFFPICFSYISRTPQIIGLRKYPVVIDEHLDWIHFLSRDVHRCSRIFLGSNKEGILSIELLELFRINRITLHCPFHESSLLNRHWMGCRRYFVANRLEVHLDEDDSRSSSWVREHGSFLIVSQLHVTIQRLWSQCLCPRAVWKNRRIVYFKRVSPFLHDLRLRFRLRLCLDLSV